MTEEQSTLENKSVIISPEMQTIIDELKKNMVFTYAEGMVKIKTQGEQEGLSKEDIRSVIDKIFKKELPSTTYYRALPDDLKSKPAQDLGRKRDSQSGNDSFKKKPLEIPAPEHKIQDAELVKDEVVYFDLVKFESEIRTILMSTRPSEKEKILELYCKNGKVVKLKEKPKVR